MLVLEKDKARAGGSSQISVHGGHQFDVGALCGEASATLLNGGTDGLLEWANTSDPRDGCFGEVRVGTESGSRRIRAHAPRAAYFEGLRRQFPAQEDLKAIERFERVLDASSFKFPCLLFIKLLLPAIRSRPLLSLFGRLFPWRNTAETLRATTENKLLQVAFTYLWGDIALPPSLSTAPMSMLCLKHYLSGSFIPVGGSSQIAARLVPTITKAGGAVLVDAPVTKLVFDEPGGRVVGVQVAGQHTLSAARVVSSAGALNTFAKLVPEAEQHRVSIALDGMREPSKLPPSKFPAFKGPATLPSALPGASSPHIAITSKEAYPVGRKQPRSCAPRTRGDGPRDDGPRDDGLPKDGQREDGEDGPHEDHPCAERGIEQPAKGPMLEPSMACVYLFVAVHDGHMPIDIPTYNLWLYPSVDHALGFAELPLELPQQDEEGKGAVGKHPISCLFISSTIKDPTCARRAAVEGRTSAFSVVGVTFTRYQYWAQFAGELTAERAQAYARFKEDLKARMLAMMLNALPILSAHTTFDSIFLGTPLDHDHHQGAKLGEMYDLAQSAEHFTQLWMHPKTAIKGLYLTGQDVTGNGIMSAAISAFATATCIDWRVPLLNAGVLAVAVKQHM